jgi:hypothetical protein
MILIKKTIENLHNLCTECRSYGTCECEKKNCNIGFSLEMIEDMKENKKNFLKDGTSLIPYQDTKYYDKKQIASTIASICKLCKECNENHRESCVISIARKSIETTVLRNMEVYPGNFLSYIINIRKQDPYFSDLIMEEYQKLS